MAKRKKRRRFRAATYGKTAYCRTFKASNCSVKIGGRRYKGKSRDCLTGKMRVCPYRRGRKTVYKVVGSDGKPMALRKVARRRRR